MLPVPTLPPASVPLLAVIDLGGVHLAGLDMVGLGIVGVLIILGLARGLWWQVIRLAGLVAAVVVARSFGDPGANWILERWPELSPRLAHGASWIGLFLGAMGLATLIGMAGHRILEAMQLGLANRLAGGILGALTGLVLHLALVVGLCQLAPTSFVEGAVAGTYSERLYAAAGERWSVVLNPVAAAEVDRLLDRSGERSQPKSSAPLGTDGGVR